MTDKMQLIESYERFTYDKDVVTEDFNGVTKKRKILKGVIQRAETLNQNGRIYPRALLEREVRNYQKFIVENRATGELDHPESSVVNFQKVSHIVRKAEFRQGSGEVYGEIELLDTPCGLIAQNLVEAGVALGISSRGVGNVKKQGEYQVVQDDFQLICWDLVSEPSTPGAFLHEGRNRIVESKDIKSYFKKSDRIYRAANDIITFLK